MPNSLLSLPTDLRGLCWNASRTLSVLSSDIRGRPQASSFYKLSVPPLMLFLCGASFWNCARNSHCTVITDLDNSKLSIQ
jgi:hypothetical protein